MMNVVFAASEAAPYAKTGGLADVAGALPLYLSQKGVKISAFMPLYSAILKKHKPKKIFSWLYSLKINKNLTFYFIAHKEFFSRKELYGEGSLDYYDNDDRFIYFCETVLKALKKLKIKPDIIHSHDWQSALVNVLVRTKYARDPLFQKTKTVFTIHNIGYQGNFAPQVFLKLGIPFKYFSPAYMEYYGGVNFLKGAIVFSDFVTTVSPSYAEEIQTAEFGKGLDGVLKEYSYKVKGLLNGIDAEAASPSDDPDIYSNYSLRTLYKKTQNKLKLQNESGLKSSEEIPLFTLVTRLDHQKGIDILLPALRSVLEKTEMQFILLGTGAAEYHKAFLKLEREYFFKLKVYLSFDSALSKKIYAAGDFFVMPSLYEPCGLSQMIAYAYGNIPVVRHTGGLADSVKDFEEGGAGVVFYNYTAASLEKAFLRAADLFNNSQEFNKVRKTAMKQKFCWDRRVDDYIKMYNEIKKKGVKMMDLSVKENIGFLAGDIFELLYTVPEGITIAALAKKMKQKEKDILFSLGWLLREDNIRIETGVKGSQKIFINR